MLSSDRPWSPEDPPAPLPRTPKTTLGVVPKQIWISERVQSLLKAAHDRWQPEQDTTPVRGWLEEALKLIIELEKTP